MISIVLLLAIVGCDGVTTVEGQVVSDGQAVEGATVTLGGELASDEPYERITEADGRFGITRTHSPTRVKLKFAVSKAGFVDHEEILEGGGVFERRVELKPAGIQQPVESR